MSDPLAALRAVSGTDLSSGATTLPNIPAVPYTDDASLTNILSAMKLWMDKAAGSGLTGFASKQDLAKAGLISMDPLGNVAYKADLNLTTPPTPTHLTASAALTSILLTWDNPQGAYANHAYTEVWAAEVDNFSQAVLIGTAQGAIYSDSVGLSAARYYWIRFVSTAGVKGPFNQVSGVGAQTGKIGNNDLGALIVEAQNLASGAIDTTKFASGIEPVGLVDSLPNPVGYNGPKTVLLNSDSKLYRYTGTGWTKEVTAADINGRGLNILDENGVPVFSADGGISSTAYVNLNGNNVLLSDVAANSLVPSINYVGEFSEPPTQTALGAQWRQNAVYKNSTDGKSYVLTGTPLGWVVYLEDGKLFYLTISSTNGTVFRVGQSSNTNLVAHLFKNGAEVTDQTPAGWFRWRRVSSIPQQPPKDDATWNSLYVTGYKQITINVDDVYARATFFCDILSS